MSELLIVGWILFVPIPLVINLIERLMFPVTTDVALMFFCISMSSWLVGLVIVATNTVRKWLAVRAEKKQ